MRVAFPQRMFVSFVVLSLLLPVSLAHAQPIYTGLIIDAKGLGIAPSLSPQITDTKDRVIYGDFDYVDPNFVISEGIVQYAESVAVAKELELSGNHPLTIHAVAKGDDPIGSSVIIKDQDGWQVLTANDLKNFLSSYKVTFIVD